MDPTIYLQKNIIGYVHSNNSIAVDEEGLMITADSVSALNDRYDKASRADPETYKDARLVVLTVNQTDS